MRFQTSDTILPTSEANRSARAEKVPAYAAELLAFHRAHGSQLRRIIAELPLQPGNCVLDLACGDGMYLDWLTERVEPDGIVIGLDASLDYLQLADAIGAAAQRNLIVGDLKSLPLARRSFDLVWCAQSLVSLPEPIAALRCMAAMAKPGGYIAVLENDSLHQLLLPWPEDLELAVRQAELEHYRDEVRGPEKRYLGRQLSSLLQQAGLVDVQRKTYAFDQMAPLESAEYVFLGLHLVRLREMALPYLSRTFRVQFDELTNEESPEYILDRSDFEATWLDFVCLGRASENPFP